MGRQAAGFARRETGAVRKKWAGNLRVALVYPNHYALGMSNLGFQSVYRLLNALDGVLCERAFLPERRVFEAPRTVESNRPLAAFDVVAFSLSFENDFPNLPAILEASGIPLLSGTREPPHPLVLAGGVACFLNPEPIAAFVDGFLLGEAEGLVEDFFSRYDPGAPRRPHLEALAREVPGTYVPALYRATYRRDGTLEEFRPVADVPETVVRRFAADLSRVPTCSTVLTPETTFRDTFLIEVARGCPHGCRFCSAGYVYRPPRFRPLSLLNRCVEEGARMTDRIGLVSTAVSDLPDLAALCGSAVDREMRVSFSSLRTDAITPEIVAFLEKSGVKTATLAPDAGSERMRLVINKGITESHVRRAVRRLVAGGIPNLKLYFMVGLPTETTTDVDAIVDMCRMVKEEFLSASRERGRIGGIAVSLNAFVPKPVTPFQWSPMEPKRLLQEKVQRVRRGLGKVANVTVKSEPLRAAYVQALLSRGDRRLADLLSAHGRSGANWAQTLKAAAADTDFYVTREREVEEILPWDFIDHGVRKSFLAAEYRRALRGGSSPPCPMKACTLCGACRKPL